MSLRRLLILNIGLGDKEDLEEKDLVEVCQNHMGFGDTSAPNLANTGRILTAGLAAQEQPGPLALQVYKSLTDMTYMDDVFATQQWGADMQPLISALEEAAALGGFSFKEWFLDGEDKSTKLLGYTWLCLPDVLRLKLNLTVGIITRGIKVGTVLSPTNVEELINSGFSQKNLLSVIAQTFDPLGLWSPLVISLRMLLSEIHRELKGKMTAEDDIPSNYKPRCIKFIQELLLGAKVEFPRSVIPHTIQDEKPRCRVAVFVDGSTQAYSTAIYIVMETKQGNVPNLLYSVTKISGSRSFSIPKMELLATELGVASWERTMTKISDYLEIVESVFLTDSQIVLRQIRMPAGRFDVFNGHRIDYIQSRSEINSWFHVSGTDNSADIPTMMGATAAQISSQAWKNGTFLHLPRDEWRIMKIDTEDQEELLPGERSKLGTSAQLSKTVKVNSITISNPGHTWIDRYLRNSVNLSTALSGLAFFEYIRDKNPQLNIRDYKASALKSIIMYSQKEIKEELLKNESFSNALVMERDGIFLAVGRNFTGIGTNQIPILPATSALTDLIVRTTHKENHLKGVQTQRELIRRSYFIPSLEKIITKINSTCSFCRRMIAEPMVQRMGAVREEQFSRSRPFRHILLDVAGPFHLKSTSPAAPPTRRSPGTDKTQLSQKVWALVMACQYTRAVWCTTLPDMTAASLIGALKRTEARFGPPRSISSDNGTNLVGSAKGQNPESILPREELDSVVKSMSSTDWRFGNPHSPWEQGGVEIYIKYLKQDILKEKVLRGERLMTILEFEELLNRISCQINSRPLILNPGVGEGICPNDLIRGRSGLTSSERSPLDIPLMDKANLMERHLKSYLQKWDVIRNRELRDLTKWRTPEENIRIGELVQILDRPTIGGFAIGKVTQTYPDEVGLIRSVKLEYSNDGKKKSILRSVRGLSRLDLLAGDLPQETCQGGSNRIELEDEITSESTTGT